MSGHGERPRDPDPAALAELARAFADSDAQVDTDTDADAGRAADSVVGGGDDRGDEMVSDSGDADSAPDEDLVTARLDVVEGDDPEAVIVTAPVDQVRSDMSPTAVDDEEDVVTGRVGAVPPAASGEDDRGASTPPAPAILEADLPDVERPDVDADLRIVEQEPPADPDPPAPRIIRIDDYSGSVELDADQGASQGVGATPAGAPVSSAPPGDDTPATGGTPPATISISDDELPDAVYVEGSLDRDGGGTIVIIEDDDTGDALAPDSERALRRGIEPRMRERRLAVRRAQGRRRLKILGVVIAAVLVVVLTLAALGTFFVVRAENVEVYNAVYTDEELLQEIIDDAIGSPVLLIDTTDYEERLEAIPWVERASVRTDFPHGLVIEIREREAITTYQGDDERFRVLDREGRVLDVLDLYPYAYVLVGGPDTPDLEPGEFAPQGFAAASELAKNLTPTVRGRVQLIEVTADGSRLVMYLDDGSTVFFGEARDLLAKLVRLEAVLTNGQDREPGLIDVSTADVTR